MNFPTGVPSKVEDHDSLGMTCRCYQGHSHRQGLGPSGRTHVGFPPMQTAATAALSRLLLRLGARRVFLGLLFPLAALLPVLSNLHLNAAMLALASCHPNLPRGLGQIFGSARLPFRRTLAICPPKSRTQPSYESLVSLGSGSPAAGPPSGGGSVG